jgi:hypothetical protein
MEHVLIEVNDLDLNIAAPKLVARAIEDTERDIASASSNIEALEGCGGGRLAVRDRSTIGTHGVAVNRCGETREHRGHKVVLPQSVDAQRHRVVHHVVA